MNKSLDQLAKEIAKKYFESGGNPVTEEQLKADIKAARIEAKKNRKLENK